MPDLLSTGRHLLVFPLAIINLKHTEFYRKYSPVPESWNLQLEEVGKTKETGGAGYEASTSFTARDVSEKYESQIHRPV